ncbi:hypothetical protein T12_12284 [Trichinella patagoniensis]|uniref:Uncharacterized protein n=1 Tax=Trichinella patagoniensis TaxID=990121 RepID=A0A0V0ZG73_9BILA|nr:hypothetical protein T12_12284 [Trichinella patagoniensis]
MITFKSVLTSICSTVLDSTVMVHLIDLYVVWTKDFVPVVKSLSGRRKEMRNLNTKCSHDRCFGQCLLIGIFSSTAWIGCIVATRWRLTAFALSNRFDWKFFFFFLHLTCLKVQQS